MKNAKLLLVAILIFPWLSLPLLGAKSFKRFLPAAFLINIVVAFESIFAKKRVWWWVFKKLGPGWKGETPFLWGPFFVGTLWILKYTYGHFLKFLLANTIVDSTFAYMMSWLKRQGIAGLIRMKKVHLLLLFLGDAVILYGLQMLVEVFNSKKYQD